MQFTPHTDSEIEEMLQFLGLSHLDDLFAMVPDAVRLAGGLAIANGRSEFDTVAHLEELSQRNRSELVCFAGAGAYDHDIPAAVRRLAGRTEYVTSYTPYQPEVAQGVLQALFEYQTMVARLSGMEVANASLYDGATACVEAVNLCVAATRRQRVLVSAGVHPNWRSTMATMAVGTGHVLEEVPVRGGTTDWSAVTAPREDVGTLVVQYPNVFGVLEDVGAASALAQEVGAKLVVAFDPVAAAVLRSPGELGATVAVAEGQPFGTPLAFGGPYVGLFACTGDEVRRLPGRLVGETVDAEGTTSYVTTLRTREQDIRRERASSNVCTNQTLIAVTAAIQMAWLGTEGLEELALRCARATRYLRESVVGRAGVELAFDAPTFRELALRLPLDPEVVVERMGEAGFLAGVPADLGDGTTGLLVTATERRTRAEIDRYAAALQEVLR